MPQPKDFEETVIVMKFAVIALSFRFVGSFLALSLYLLAMFGQSLAQCPANTNVIVNPNADSQPTLSGNVDHDVAGWTDTPSGVYGTFTVISYELGGGFPTVRSPGPLFRGSHFFSGGPAGALSFGEQTYFPSPECYSAIDSGRLGFGLSGWFGGFADQNDFAELRVRFFNANSNQIGDVIIGAVSAADRNNVTGLLFRSANGLVPPSTRRLEITLQMTRVTGDNDGYADSLDLRFLVPSAAAVVLGGRVVDALGNGVSGARVSLSGIGSEERTVTTNSFGYFKFENVEAGQSYLIAVSHKLLSFEPRLVTVEDSVEDLVISATGDSKLE